MNAKMHCEKMQTARSIIRKNSEDGREYSKTAQTDTFIAIFLFYYEILNTGCLLLVLRTGSYMIAITFNGASIELAKDISVAEFIATYANQQLPFALAINQQFVPKSDYQTRLLCAGDAVEIVSPMQGG